MSNLLQTSHGGQEVKPSWTGFKDAPRSDWNEVVDCATLKGWNGRVKNSVKLIYRWSLRLPRGFTRANTSGHPTIPFVARQPLRGHADRTRWPRSPKQFRGPPTGATSHRVAPGREKVVLRAKVWWITGCSLTGPHRSGTRPYRPLQDPTGGEAGYYYLCSLIGLCMTNDSRRGALRRRRLGQSLGDTLIRLAAFPDECEWRCHRSR